MIDPNLITTIAVGELPPQDITLNSLIAHELLGVLKKSNIEQLLSLLRPLVSKLQFEIVELDVTEQYIIDNFDLTGLGKNLCLGFAICNGQNGTKDRDGRGSIAYGVAFNFTGALGGFKDSTLVEHSHNFQALGDVSANKTLRFGTNPDIETSFESLTTASAGVSGLNRNYQPYIVTLTIMKL